MTPIEVSFLRSNFFPSGHLYVPENIKTGEKLPAIIVVHPGGGVKEQTAGTYAKELSTKGFVTLAFDRRSQGASKGTPRCVEDPYANSEDVKSVVTFITLNDNVDPKRIGVLDHRIKAVGAVSMVYIGGLFTAIPKENLEVILDQAVEARTEYAKTGEVKHLPYLPSLDQITSELTTLMKEGVDYYLTPRGAHPRSVNKFAIWSYDIMTSYNSFAKIEGISPRSSLFIVGTAADTRPFSVTAFEKAQEPKELYCIEGATHIELYDHKVSEVVPKLTDFYTKNL